MKKYKAFQIKIAILARESTGEWESLIRAEGLTATSKKELYKIVKSEIEVALMRDDK